MMGDGNMSSPAIKTLQDQELAAAQAAGEDFFLDIPDAWYEPHAVYGCDNGHASVRYLKSETRGCLCLACYKPVAIMPHLPWRERAVRN